MSTVVSYNFLPQAHPSYHSPMIFPSTTTTTDRLVIAGPSSLLQTPKEKRFLLLPHPRTSLPTYFLPASSSSCPTEYDQIYELQATKSDRKARSWFLNGVAGSEDDTNGTRVEEQSIEDKRLNGAQGWVLQDPSLHILSQIHPTFLLLPILDTLLPKTTDGSAPSAPSAPLTSILAESGSYIPLEDLFEVAASTLYNRLVQKHDTVVGKETESKLTQDNDDDGVWPDLLAFGQLRLAKGALEKLCSTQEVGTGNEERYYRPCPTAIATLLRRKVEALSTSHVFEQHPTTLTRILDKALDDPLAEIARANGQSYMNGSGGDKESQYDPKARRIRREIALELVRAYIPMGGRIEEIFETIVKGEVMRQCDGEHRNRKEEEEDHDEQWPKQGSIEGEDADAEEVQRQQEEGKGQTYLDL